MVWWARLLRTRLRRGLHNLARACCVSKFHRCVCVCVPARPKNPVKGHPRASFSPSATPHYFGRFVCLRTKGRLNEKPADAHCWLGEGEGRVVLIETWPECLFAPYMNWRDSPKRFESRAQTKIDNTVSRMHMSMHAHAERRGNARRWKTDLGSCCILCMHCAHHTHAYGTQEAGS